MDILAEKLSSVQGSSLKAFRGSHARLPRRYDGFNNSHEFTLLIACRKFSNCNRQSLSQIPLKINLALLVVFQSSFSALKWVFRLGQRTPSAVAKPAGNPVRKRRKSSGKGSKKKAAPIQPLSPSAGAEKRVNATGSGSSGAEEGIASIPSVLAAREGKQMDFSAQSGKQVQLSPPAQQMHIILKLYRSSEGILIFGILTRTLKRSHFQYLPY